MKYQLRVPALFGDIIPLICVAETKAKRDATAGGTPFHKPCFDGRRRQYVDDLLDEARLGNLKVCNQLGSPRTVDEIIATGNPVTVMRNDSEIDSNMTHICGLYATLKALNKWAKKRGDEFTISKDSVEWIDERGVMGLPPQSQGKVDQPSGNGDWKAHAREIADECFDKDTANNCRDSLVRRKNGVCIGGYAYRVMELMQERGIKGPRGIVDNGNYVAREALQGEKWWALRSK